MFVTFEGPEGAGKTTLIRSLEATLLAEGRDVIITREPGAGEVGKAIRDILLHGMDLDERAELFLFLADRAEHVAKLVRPAIAQGACVLCDRFADSTVVYQGYGRGLDLDQLRAMNRFATGGLVPDLTLLLDLDPRRGLERLASRDRLDRQPIEFHERVRQGFLAEAKLETRRWRVLDASRPAEMVLAQALAELQPLLSNAGP